MLFVLAILAGLALLFAVPGFAAAALLADWLGEEAEELEPPD